MEGLRVSNLKLTVLVVVVAIGLVALSKPSITTAIAQEQKTEKREIDLRDKLKAKKFADGRRVEIHAFQDRNKIVAEIRNGVFLNWFLVTADGTEVKGDVKKKDTTTNDTPTTAASTCTVIVLHIVQKNVNGQVVNVPVKVIVLVPCGNTTAS